MLEQHQNSISSQAGTLHPVLGEDVSAILLEPWLPAGTPGAG